jgi:Bacterial regulatory proteins, tetR family
VVDSAYEQAEAGLRDRLIDVGVELVTSGGTAAVSLREIARRAGVSHGAPRLPGQEYVHTYASARKAQLAEAVGLAASTQ